MSFNRDRLTADAISLGAQTGVGAGVMAASGVAGAAVLQAAGYIAMSKPEAAIIGAAGGAVLGAANSLLESVGMFKRTKAAASIFDAPYRMIGFGAITSLIGYGITQSARHTEMDMNMFTALGALVVGSSLLYYGVKGAEIFLGRNNLPTAEVSTTALPLMPGENNVVHRFNPM